MARYPIAPYIHMSEMFSGADPFERVVGWTDEKLNQLVIDAAHVLQGLDKSGFRSIACTIDLTACNALIKEGRAVADGQHPS